MHNWNGQPVSYKSKLEAGSILANDISHNTHGSILDAKINPSPRIKRIKNG